MLGVVLDSIKLHDYYIENIILHKNIDLIYIFAEVYNAVFKKILIRFCGAYLTFSGFVLVLDSSRCWKDGIFDTKERSHPVSDPQNISRIASAAQKRHTNIPGKLQSHNVSKS